MARAMIVDPQPEEENVDQIENNEVDEIQQEQEVEQPQEPSLPEKYHGKSLEEVVQMHQEAEKPAPQQQYVEPEDDIDYFTDPQGAVNRAIENHPKIREAEQYSADYKKQSALAALNNKHPDMQEILGDPKFAEWIKASKIRTQLFVAADQQYDAESADELFSLWKERKQVVQQTANVEKQERKQQLKAASTGNAKGSAEGTRKKVYRRADIIKLMKTDPERYQALSNEILQAYAEGRVK
jgi:hypothetical protein